MDKKDIMQSGEELFKRGVLAPATSTNFLAKIFFSDKIVVSGGLISNAARSKNFIVS